MLNVVGGGVRERERGRDREGKSKILRAKLWGDVQEKKRVTGMDETHSKKYKRDRVF